MQLGWKLDEDCEEEYIYSPKAIPYFINNGIKIKDIESGNYHNLAVDIYGRLYSWGNHQYGQCGVAADCYYCLPTLVEDLKDYEVDKIRCGSYHSYVRTKCGRHYLFGSNRYNQCVNFNDDEYIIARPYRIDQIVYDKYNGRLLDVCLGHDCTTFIVSTASK